MSEINSIECEPDNIYSLEEISKPDSIDTDSALSDDVSYEQPARTSNIKQDSICKHFHIEHCRKFVAMRCNYNPRVMEALDKTLASWIALSGEPDFPLERMLSAVEFAAEKHQHQTRKNPEQTPYIIHPLGVAHIALELGGITDSNALIAALLHDTLEDTDATPAEIGEKFGTQVLALVQDLTNTPGLEGDDAKEDQIKHAPFMHKYAKVVKLADRYYNICDLKDVIWGKSRKTNYVLWGAKLAQVLRGTNSALEQAIDKEVTTHFQSYFPTRIEVGKLGPLWQFPSDHLPIGACVDDIEMVSWNVLNNTYMEWVTEKDSQGLNGSLISKKNQVIDQATGLTRRDQIVVQKVIDMLNHPTYPKHLIALQECSPEFLKELEKTLPDYMQIIYESENFPVDQNVVLFDSRTMDHRKDLMHVDYPFPCAPKRQLMNLVFEREGKTYRFINGHLPGDPNLPGKEEFATYVNGFSDEVVIATGDMNFTRDEMLQAFLSQGGNNLPFALLHSYPTNVGLNLCSKGIDHFYVRGTTHWNQRTPTAVLQGLDFTLDLLTNSRRSLKK